MWPIILALSGIVMLMLLATGWLAATFWPRRPQPQREQFLDEEPTLPSSPGFDGTDAVVGDTVRDRLSGRTGEVVRVWDDGIATVESADGSHWNASLFTLDVVPVVDATETPGSAA